jgi:hypothetical protein
MRNPPGNPEEKPHIVRREHTRSPACDAQAFAQSFANREISAEKPQETVDGFFAVRIMRRSFARQGVAGGLKNASKPVDQGCLACIMVGLPGKNPGPLFNSTIK